MDCILMENCRLCQSKPGIFPFILDEEFIQKTMECTKITLDDDLNSLLPNFICDDCKMKILEFSEYINEVKRIDENLRRIASSYTQMDSPSKNDAEMESEHKCNKCPATFSDTETYDIHLKSHSTVSKFECTVCSKTFNRECNFELHMKNHLELYCSMCDSTFTNGAEKEVHICAVHVKKEEIEDDSDMTKEALEEVIPSKSRKIYEQQYDNLLKWCTQRKLENFSEDVLLVFFNEKSKSVTASTLWAHYSMLKTMLRVKNCIDISKYFKLIDFLKRKNVGYKPKKSKVLTGEQLDKFLIDAPDDKFLMIKVVIIFGVAGACKGNELVQLQVNDVTDLGQIILVNIKNTKNYVERNFIVKNSDQNAAKFVDICKKYIALRKCDTPHSRFFVRYFNNQCTTQAIGKNTFGKVPQKVAEFLNLPNKELYTGHCLRRTSASLLIDSGVTVNILKRRGLYKPTVVSESYAEDSVNDEQHFWT